MTYLCPLCDNALVSKVWISNKAYDELSCRNCNIKYYHYRNRQVPSWYKRESTGAWTCLPVDATPKLLKDEKVIFT